MNNQVTKSIIVKGPVDKIYNIWANFENFPRFMEHVKSVKKTGETTSHWIVKGPFGKELSWDAETTRLEKNKRIAWNSTGGDVKTSGQVTFTPLPQDETQVTVVIQYVTPVGIAKDVIDQVLGNPDKQLVNSLRNFKAYVENRHTD